MRIREYQSLWVAIPTAVFYGLSTYQLFKSETLNEIFGLLTCGALLFMPISVGAVTVWLSPKSWKPSFAYAFLAPWFSIIVLELILVFLEKEAFICLLMATPVLMLMASAGGVFVHTLNKNGAQGTQNISMLVLALFPFVSTPIERQLPPPTTLETVSNQIVINAPVEAVWRNIVTVPAIRPHEHRFNFFHTIGLPRPVEAVLTHPGVGGVRHASFEDGLLFVETITEWEDGRTIRFQIDEASRPLLPPPLNQIGGEQFDVLEGVYVIEPVADGSVILHLSSRHRLTTQFNWYGRLWTRWVMSDLQQYILAIIKQRAETQ